MVEFQTFQEKLSILLKLFQKTENISKLILWGQHHPDTKARQRHKKTTSQYPWMNIDTNNLNEILADQI